MKVLKFGGTSVGSPDNIRLIIDILKKRNEDALAVVVSAFGGVTDRLIETSRLAASGNEEYQLYLRELADRHHHALKDLVKGDLHLETLGALNDLLAQVGNVMQGVFLVRELSPKSMDLVTGYGERLSSLIITAAFKQAGLKANWVNSADIIKTDGTFTNARVNFKDTNTNISALQNEKGILVIPGFIATSTEGIYTTLGRGGSDYTAAIFAAGLHAETLEIWTDVDGVMTANPRAVKKAFPIGQLSYDEAMELSYFGAKVIYPPTIQPALAQHIPIQIKNTFNPDAPGTLISKESVATGRPVKGITSIDKIALVTVSGSGMIGIPGTSMRLFGALGQAGISVILISQASSEHSISFAVAGKDAHKAQEVLEIAFELELQAGKINPIEVDQELAIMAIVGENMKNTPGIAGKLFSTLGGNGINVVAIAQGTSELNISFVVPSKDEHKALNLIHEAFFLSDVKTVHLFFAGVGLVGSTLLRQIAQQQEHLKDDLKIELKVAGLANSKKILLKQEGIDPRNWEDDLANSIEPSNPVEYAKHIIDMNLRNSIFLDCTAHANVAEVYDMLLDASVSVVAANKIASSSDYGRYLNLKQLAAARGVKYYFETNVGAGLPVLSTLSDLVRSGDVVRQIDAVLSGTMNFIFNNVSADSPLSVTVRKAKEQGFTEPDPRIDLSGLDVARKILILAREAGYVLEPEDVTVENFLPDAVFQTDDMDGFWDKLEDHDHEFEEFRKKIDAAGERLRLVASFDGKSATVSMKAYKSDHPLYNLEGSDSIVLFQTDRYKAQPLVVKGAGAGAEVTAAGVFADVIRIVN